jgi:hypothetical protein
MLLLAASDSAARCDARTRGLRVVKHVHEGLARVFEALNGGLRVRCMMIGSICPSAALVCLATKRETRRLLDTSLNNIFGIRVHAFG